MLDPDTFLTALYVQVDDFCKTHPLVAVRPGPAAALSRSEVVTLAVCAGWSRFTSERAFYRYAAHHLRAAFPSLPHRTQFNRLVRHAEATITAFFLHLVERLDTGQAVFEALDSTAVATRDAKRRHDGWLAGQADIGWSNRLGWYEGLHLLCAATPDGVLTGYGVGPASAKDQALAEVFFAMRAHPDGRLPSVGHTQPDFYLVDKGFEGRAHHTHWAAAFGAVVVCPPKRNAQHPWPKPLRRWIAGLRQIIETVSGKLHIAFRLDTERPHTLAGFHARLAATAALHNFCIWLNRQLG